MFPVTMTIHNTAQLTAVMLALGSVPAAAEPSTADLVQIAKDRANVSNTGQIVKEAAGTAGKPAKDAPAPGQRTAKAPAAAAPEKTADVSAQPAGIAEAEPQDSTAATEITYEQVGKAITEKAKTDRPHVIATLASFKVSKGPELKPEQYADFLKALG